MVKQDRAFVIKSIYEYAKIGRYNKETLPRALKLGWAETSYDKKGILKESINEKLFDLMDYGLTDEQLDVAIKKSADIFK